MMPRSPDEDLRGSCGCSVKDLLPNLTYCAAHRPPFDPTSQVRYDRRPSNPAAAGLFPDDAGRRPHG